MWRLPLLQLWVLLLMALVEGSCGRAPHLQKNALLLEQLGTGLLNNRPATHPRPHAVRVRRSYFGSAGAAPRPAAQRVVGGVRRSA